MIDDGSRTLRRALRANATFSAASGAAMLAADGLVAAALGAFESLGEIQIVGVSLVAFALALVWMARREVIRAGEAIAVVAADLSWVAASTVALALAPLPRTGAIAVALVAAVVASFAIWQGVGIARMRKAADAA